MAKTHLGIEGLGKKNSRLIGQSTFESRVIRQSVFYHSKALLYQLVAYGYECEFFTLSLGYQSLIECLALRVVLTSRKAAQEQVITQHLIAFFADITSAFYAGSTLPVNGAQTYIGYELAVVVKVSIKVAVDQQHGCCFLANTWNTGELFHFFTGFFPELYPLSGKSKGDRRAVLSKYLSAYYVYNNKEVTIIAFIDNRNDQAVKT